MQTQSDRNYHAIGEQLKSIDEKVSDNFNAIDILARYGQDRFEQVKILFKQAEERFDQIQNFNSSRFSGLDRRIDDLAVTRPKTETIEEIYRRLDRIEDKVFSTGSPA